MSMIKSTQDECMFHKVIILDLVPAVDSPKIKKKKIIIKILANLPVLGSLWYFIIIFIIFRQMFFGLFFAVCMHVIVITLAKVIQIWGTFKIKWSICTLGLITFYLQLQMLYIVYFFVTCDCWDFSYQKISK